MCSSQIYIFSGMYVVRREVQVGGLDTLRRGALMLSVEATLSNFRVRRKASTTSGSTSVTLPFRNNGRTLIEIRKTE